MGETVRIFNGNVIDLRSDLQFSSPNRMGLGLGAVYNNQKEDQGIMGYGWTHTYELSLDPTYDLSGFILLRIVDETGKGIYFLEDSPGEYKGIYNELSRVMAEGGGYVWYRLDGRKYSFSATGQLEWIDDEVENRLTLIYDTNDRLEKVIDMASGRVLTFYYNANNLLDHVTGPITTAVSDGIWVSYGYDGNNNLTSVTYADGSGLDYEYTDSNDLHNLTAKRDRMNHLKKTWTYDNQDRVTANYSVEGRGVSLVYVNEYQVNVTDAYGKMREYHLEDVNGRKRIDTIINGPGGAGGMPYNKSNIVSWNYDSNMRVIEVETAGGTIHQYQNYDNRGNPGTVILAQGTPEQRTITYTYHPDLNVPLTRTEPSVLGGGYKETIWDYDSDGNDVYNESPTNMVYQIIEKGFTRDQTGSIVSYKYTTAFTYNSKGQVVSIDGPKAGNDVTTFAYDPVSGNLTSITRALIGATVFTNYDAAGQVGTVTDVNNHSTTYTYDGRGRVTDTTYEDLTSNSVTYNTAGLIDLRTDEDLVTTAYTYDTTSGRLEKITDHEGNYILHTYDTQGNLIEKSYYDPLDVRSNQKRFDYQYPLMPGKLYKEINADNTFVEYGYDLEGNVSSVTDARNYTTSYAYDPLNRLETVTQPGNIITTYSYDAQGNLQNVTDAEGHITAYTYDDMGRLVETISTDTGTVAYVYDEAGNLTWKKDAENIEVYYTYDDLNRLILVDFPTDQDITYAYDQGTNGKGRRIGMTDASGSMTFGYSDRGRLINKTMTVNSIDYPVSRVYTPGGRFSSLTYPSGRTIDFHRQICACSVDSVDTTYNSNTVTLVNNLSYRPFGGATGLSNGVGGNVTNQHDQMGRLTVGNPGAQHEMTYGYDNNGNLTSINAPSMPWYTRVYNYDPLNRLDHAEAPDAFGTIDYNYDDVGNRLTQIESGVTTTYTYYPDTNKLYEAVTDAQTVTYTYDANGNITGIGPRTLVYNQNNRLIRVEEGRQTLGGYTYNGLGQRVKKTVDSLSTIYIYDFDGNIIAESNDSGTFSKEYLYNGRNRMAMVDVSTGEFYYYLNDQLGTPQMMVDSTNTVIWESVYKPFGEGVINPLSGVTSHFRLPGQYYDSETGFHYNWNRYYDPKSGRYLRTDPIGLKGGINLFIYTNNRPTNICDPSGLSHAEVGGGFSFTIPGWHFDTSMSTEICCDNNGKKHIRAIQTTCFGFSLGLEFGGGGGPGSGNICIVREYKKCKGSIGDSYEYDMGFGFSSALIGGASWSSSDPTTTTLIVGLGGAAHFWSRCKDLVKKDVIIGDCNG